MPDGALAGSGGNAAAQAARNLVLRQGADGSWEGEVVWCPIITAQVVILDIATGRTISAERRRLIARHFAATRRPDGGWGLHPESCSYRFVTTLVYVAARLLGETPDEPLPAPGARWLAAQPGGVWSLPQWGKIWLSLIGLYDRAGPQPVSAGAVPAAALAARSHRHGSTATRATSTSGSPISWARGSRPISDRSPRRCGASSMARPAPRMMRRAIATIWRRAMRMCARAAVCVSPTIWRTPRHVMAAGCRVPRGCGAARSMPAWSASVTSSGRPGMQGLSPVSGVLNTLALSAREPESADAAASRDGIERWLWEDETEGARYAGARSTTWDTSFALQALAAGSGLSARGAGTRCATAIVGSPRCRRAKSLPGGTAQRRDPILGGWCFSDGAHRWPVSDCTAEALIAVLGCHDVPGPDRRRGPDSAPIACARPPGSSSADKTATAASAPTSAGAAGVSSNSSIRRRCSASA